MSTTCLVIWDSVRETESRNGDKRPRWKGQRHVNEEPKNGRRHKIARALQQGVTYWATQMEMGKCRSTYGNNNGVEMDEKVMGKSQLPKCALFVPHAWARGLLWQWGKVFRLIDGISSTAECKRHSDIGWGVPAWLRSDRQKKQLPTQRVCSPCVAGFTCRKI